MCDKKLNWDRAERINNILSPEKCELQCRTKKSCLSYEWKANKSSCVLLSDKVDLTDIKALSPSNETKRICGVFMDSFDSFPPSSIPSLQPSPTPSTSVQPTAPTESPTTSSPTISPSAATTYKKVYIGDENTKCGGDIDWSTTKKITYYTSREQCQRKCSMSKKCETFEWNGVKSTCIIFRDRVNIPSIKSLKANGYDRICAYTVGSILKESPVADNSVRKQCILRADLKFDFDDPDDAPYYGYHSDYMEVLESGNYDWICSHRYIDELPDWCTYQNSDPDGEYAYIANLDDEYYDDEEEEIHTETIEVIAAAGRSFEFFVYHYFEWNDYYTYLDTWKDHMMVSLSNITLEFSPFQFSDSLETKAPKLSITNLSHKTQKQVGKGGWSHPVDKNVPTHLGKGQKNPNYKGKFKVNVSCNDNCYCKSEYKLLR